MFWEKKQQEERKGDSENSPLQEGFLEEVDNFRHGTFYQKPMLTSNIMITAMTVPHSSEKAYAQGVFCQS